MEECLVARGWGISDCLGVRYNTGSRGIKRLKKQKSTISRLYSSLAQQAVDVLHQVEGKGDQFKLHGRDAVAPGALMANSHPCGGVQVEAQGFGNFSAKTGARS